MRFGIRMHTINRDTSEEAWAEADRLLEGIDEAAIRRVQEGLRRQESVGQQNMLALNNGSRDGLEIHPNVWAGVGLVRGGAGTALVGSHEEVADRIEEYAALGIEEFVLSGYPHLEGAYWFGEGVLPVLAGGACGNPAPVAASASVPFGGQRGRVVSARTSPSWSATPSHARARTSPRHVAELTGRGADLVVDLADHGVRLFDWGATGTPSWSPRRAPPAWSSSPARPTRRPTPGCSRRSSTASPVAPGSAAPPSR